jgi:hypothetical protein
MDSEAQKIGSIKSIKYYYVVAIDQFNQVKPFIDVTDERNNLMKEDKIILESLTEIPEEDILLQPYELDESQTYSPLG